MLDFRPILYVVGILLVPLGLAMLIPAIVDATYGNQDWRVFVESSAFTLFIGGGLYIGNRDTHDGLSLKQAFIFTTLIWVVLPAFAAMPLLLSELNLSYTDAYFEAMSGLTTTGSTVITGLDNAPPGILMWRAILQWLGGIGIIVMAVAVLPMLKVGGMQLFRMESSDTSEKILPRAAQISGAISWLYFVFTFACFVALMAAGLDPFDAAAHAMTTISTGGFSTSDGSVGHFNSGVVDTIIMIFMILGSLPFVLYLQALRGRPLALWRDSQVRMFFYICGFIVFSVVGWLIVFKNWEVVDAIRFGSFNSISIMTGTGFSTDDYGTWGGMGVSAFFMIMFIGGCAGSTSCGVKIFRYQVMGSAIKAQIKRLNHPHGIFHATFNNRPIGRDVISSVMSFLFLFLATYVVLTLMLSATGIDFLSAASGAGTALANVGPGLGDIIGPSGTFGPLPTTAKWILCLGMLVGRLEIFTVFVLLTPTFWRA